MTDQQGSEGQPLQFTFQLTPDISFVTDVLGDERDRTQESTLCGAVVVYTNALTAASPQAQVGSLPCSQSAIKRGAFTLTIPTVSQLGMVAFDGVIQISGGPETPVSIVIAQWSLA